MSDNDRTDEPKPSRLERWFLRRIRLWIVGLIVLVLISGAVSFWWPMYRGGKIIERIESQDGVASIRYEHPEWLFWIEEETYHPWFDSIQSLWMNDVEIDDAFLSELKIFSELETLVLETGSLTPDAIRSISEFQNLDFLAFNGNNDHCPLDWIASLPKLEVMSLSKISLADPDSNLRGLTRTNVDTVAFEQMELDLSAGIAIAQMSALEQLVIKDCRADSAFWSELAKSKTLSTLQIVETAVHSEDLQHLVPLSSLTQLDISYSKLAPADLSQFKEARKDVNVTIRVYEKK